MQRAASARLFSLTQNNNEQDAKNKRIIFLRHGRTYMNEYLSKFSFGCPDFTDVFREDERHRYQDSPLSPTGANQAQTLAQHLSDIREGKPGAHGRVGLSEEDVALLGDLDLIVSSPLTRALKTLELGLLPHVKETNPSPVPIIASPLATERLYLISDIGKPRSVLEKEFGHYVDFETGFSIDTSTTAAEHWWFMLEDHAQELESCIPSGLQFQDYQEWRPNGEGQEYACPGEPDDHFERRMVKLYRWLESRPESTVALVCHWGVIDWFLGEDFANCQMRVVPFHELAPKTTLSLEGI